jgi:molybdate transport system substrate-binding protein
MKLLLIALLLTFNIEAKSIKIAVSANVSYAIHDLTKAFNKLYPDIKVQVTLAGTGKLTAQIKNGAPYQILMGANMLYPETLYKEDFAITKPLIYAQGSLAYLSKDKKDFTKGMELLKSKDIKKIAIANPKTAPYGTATLEALKNANVYDTIKSKLVYGESISQTVIYTTKATDIGFIAKSSLYSPTMSHFKEGENWAELDPKLYTPINQGIVILKKGEGSMEVSAFYAFIFSKTAQNIFKTFGYITP